LSIDFYCFVVIPAKAGFQLLQHVLDSRLRGNECAWEQARFRR